MTIQQHASFDSSAAELNATSKLVKAWESKNAKNAAKAGGISMMALSLAACGGSSTTTTTATDTTTDTTVDTTPVVVAGKTIALTSGIDSGSSFTGSVEADQFTATASSLSISDVLDGGAGNDTLKITDAAGGLEAGLASNLTLTSIENVEISSSAGLGVVGTSAVPQENTYTMSTPTADVVGITSIDIGANTLASDVALTVSYLGNTVGFATDTNVEETTAINMKNAINIAAGSETAFVGGTVAVNDGTVGGVPLGTTITLDTLSTGISIQPGMTVTGTGIAAGTTVVSYASNVVTLSAATTIKQVDDAVITIGGGADHVVIYGTAGAGQPSVGISNATGMTVLTSRAAVDGTEGNTVTFKYGDLSGSYLIGATATATGNNFVTALNNVAGSTVAANVSGTVTLTAPTAGTALPLVSFTGDNPDTAYTVANVVAAGTTAFDLSGYTDVIDVTASVVGGANVKLAGTQDMTIVNAADSTDGAGEVQVAGGKVLNITTSGTGSVDVDGKDITEVTVTGGSGGVDIDNLGGAAGTTSAEGTTLTKVTLTKVDGNSTVAGDALLDVTVGGATTAARTVTISNDQAALGHDLTLTAAGTGYKADGTTEVQTVVNDTNAKQIDLSVTAKSSVDLTGNSAMKTLNISGEGAAKISADMAILTKIDASANTGGVDLGAVNAKTVSITGGAGVDKLTIDTSAAYAFNLGAGNDVVTVTSAVAATSAVSGGTGVDTLVVGTPALFDSAAEIAKYTSFETLRLADDNDTAEDYNMNLFGSVTAVEISAMSHANDDITLSNMSATQAGNVKVIGDLGGDLKVDLLTDTGTADATTITFGTGLKATEAFDVAGAVIANGVETINLVTNAGPDATTANKTATIASFTSDVATAINLTGHSFDLTDAATTKAAVIDGSALTGGLTVAGSLVATSTVKGSDLVDAMTVGQIGSTYNGNDGKDTFSGLTTAIMANGGSFTTIDGGAGDDTIATTDAAQTLVDVDFEKMSNIEKLKLDVDGGANALSVTGSAEFSQAFSSGVSIDADVGAATTTFALGNATVAVTLDLATATATVDNNITTGSGNDVVTISSMTAATTAETNVSTGAGNDTITIDTTSGSGVTLDLSSNVMDVTGGTGADVIDVTISQVEAAYVAINVAAGDSTTTAFDTINNAVLSDGSDAGFKLNFDGSADHAAGVTNITMTGFTASEAKFSSNANGKVTFAGTKASELTFTQKLDAVAGEFVTANDTVVFEHDGSSYVFHNDNTNGDSLVMIAGLSVTGLDTDGVATGELIIA